MTDPRATLAQRNLAAQSAVGVPEEIPFYSDTYIIEVLVLSGQPRWAAEEIRTNPMARGHALSFVFDVEDAGRGDKQARQRVDFIREQWAAMRKEELLADDPRRMHDVKIDPRELL